MSIKPKSKTATPAKPPVAAATKSTVKASAMATSPMKAKAAKAAAAPKAPKVPKESKESRFGCITRLVLEQKFTDDEIHAMVLKEGHKAFPKSGVSVARWTINQSLTGKKIERFVKVDGKLVPKSQAPKKVGARKKVDPANDPLKKLAGIAARPKAAKPKK